MRRTGKKLAALGVLTVLVFNLAACGTKDFDASGYVKAFMDAMYHQEYEAYAELLELSVEETEQSIIEENKKDIEESYGDLGEITEEDIDKYHNAFYEVFKNTRFEVKEAEETEDKNYVVTVEIEPTDTFTKFNEGVEEKALEAFADAEEIPTDQEVLDFTIEYLLECNQNVSYGDIVTVEVNVTHDADNVYSIPDEDIEALQNAMMPGISE